MKSEEFDTCMGTLLAAWPHSRQESRTFELAEQLLAGLPSPAVQAAIAQFSLEGREHAPTIGMIARRAVELVAQAEGYRVPDVDEALAEVRREIARVGHVRAPEFTHPAIAAAVEAIGGWQACCMDDNPEAFRAHFMRLYGSYRARSEREALNAPALAQLMAGLDLRADRELAP